MTSRMTGEGLVPRDGVPPSGNPPASNGSAGSSVRSPLRRVVRIINPLGLHFRAADRFARAAKKYSCAVTVSNGDLKADGKDIMALLTLIAMPDTDVVLEVDGLDAAVALESLAEVLGAPSGEDYTI